MGFGEREEVQWSCSFFFFSRRRRHTRFDCDWSSDVCFSDIMRRHTRFDCDWSSDVCSSDLTLNQTIVVDNRPGASTNIGAQIVATAKPDGYTIMSADNAVLAYNEHLFSKLSFNPEKDFTYIGGISRFPM